EGVETTICLPKTAWPPTSAVAPAAATTAPAVAPRDAALARVLQAALDSSRAAQRLPGLSLALALPDGRTLALTSGHADTARRVPLRPTDRLLQGSVGKTYVAAVAMQLVAHDSLDLDAPVARYLGHLPWWPRVPNARDVTVRQLMTHTSGLVRYEFDPRATAVLRAQPMKTWTPEERLSYLLDKAPPFAAGQGWDYSDTNYIVLGMILERITGTPYDSLLRTRLLGPLGLAGTVPADRPDVPAIANGYAGADNELGGYDASLDARGHLLVNPQFEWTGGGVASTTADLARWGKLLYEGRAFDAALLPRVLDGVPARLGRDVRYGLGVMLRPTALGVTWGHSGFFPGYATELLYFPELKIAVAVQANSTAPYPRGLVPLAVAAARAASQAP
ncbi:serine hydrolase domain-containing protein, partial [Roseisolibacter sp. H3M3-2]|uniref:serine hydrolase domain-containing protein n=1 Tax=Roseisolibacter sp. H3M3-2 TaxID=3031323 RepID=UPI0023DB515A